MMLKAHPQIASMEVIGQSYKSGIIPALTHTIPKPEILLQNPLSMLKRIFMPAK
jgi:hypothetical protein